MRSLDKKLYDSKIKDIDFAQARILAAEENKIFVAKQLKSLGVENYQRLIGISPFGKSSSRFGGNFSLQEWIEITQELAQLFKECGFILMNYSKSGVAFGNFSQPNIKIFKNNEDLLNLVEFLNSLDLLLSVNTGVVHIADNLGIPTLEIIRKSESKKWAGGAYAGWGDYKNVILPKNWQQDSQKYKNLFLQEAKACIINQLKEKI